MQVSVRFAGSMRELAGQVELPVALPDHATLGDLLQHLVAVLPGAFTALVIQPLLSESARLPAIMTINRKAVPVSDFPRRNLRDGDTIVFVPPMEGG